EKLAHTATEWIIDENATCETNGSKHKECTVCGNTIDTQVIVAIGHNYGVWTVTKAATCIAYGEETRYCSNDNSHFETRNIEKLAHVKGEIVKVVAPNCRERGYTVYACGNCGGEFISDYVSKLDHSYNTEWVCSSCGHEFATDGLVYELSSDGSYYIVIGYKGTSADVIIPAHYNELPVTQIASSAFYGCSCLVSVTISYNVTFISSGSFGDCENLTTLKVMAGNTTYYSANNCIIRSDTYTLIVGCKSSIIPNDGSVIIINDRAFDSCKGLTNISIPGTVEKIRLNAFYGCSNLASLSIEEGVKEIQERAFSYCGINSLIIPNSVTNIDNYAFIGCKDLKTVEIGSGLESINYSSSFSNFYRLFQGCTSIKSITISSGNKK
ncbi:MAG: leucine-rich repeat domain-containing protein, partial [Clostridia bacterium]|nr:leucine-rich repeat domain-containing protein [Clostridia bacterium]